LSERSKMPYRSRKPSPALHLPQWISSAVQRAI